MRQGQRLRGSAEELLEFEVEAEVAQIDRQPSRGRLGQRPGGSRQPSVDSGGLLGFEGWVSGEKLIGTIAAEDDLDLSAREPAQEVGGKNRSIAEGFIQPGRDVRQKLVNLGYRKGLLVMISAEAAGHGPGMPALVEAGILKAYRKGMHAACWLDLAQRRGDA